jgi:DNA-binding winged helix-turn-helix (wHTH) protein/TolB-like protein/cytochrome c-type biogenesis protein CcmH/NrfG
MPAHAPILAFGPYVLDSAARRLLRDGQAVAVTPKAFDLLTVLAQNAGRIVSKDLLLRSAWPDAVVDEGNLAFQVSTLRKALGESSEGDRYIVTVPGQGYQLVKPVRRIEQVEWDLLVEERDTTTITIQRRPGRRILWIASMTAVVLALIGAIVLLRPGRGAAPPVPRQIRTLAVLPFKPIVVAQRDEALELGMADALISRIAGNPELTVRPLTAVRNFGGVEQDAVSAGRELGVDAVLDGTIRTAGQRIRVTARLVRVADSAQLWSGQFDENFGEILAIQDSISTRLASELAITAPAKSARPGTTSQEAYRAYALGRLHYLRTQSAEVDRAIVYFKKAAALDPEYAAAWSGLAECYASLPISADRAPQENFELAERAAKRAIELDPSSSDAYTTLGTVKFMGQWDWAGAEANFKRALALNNSSAMSHLRYAHLLSNTGRHREAMQEAREALRLDPLSPLVNALTGQFSLQAGDVDEGMRQLRHTLEIDPGFWNARMNLGKGYEMQGRYDDALIELEKCRGASGDNVEPLWMIGYIHGVRGNRAEAQKILDELRSIASERYVPAAKIALVYIGMGDRDNAFRLLERACRERDRTMVFLDVNPRFRKLSGDPRYEAITRCVNLPQL